MGGLFGIAAGLASDVMIRSRLSPDWRAVQAFVQPLNPSDDSRAKAYYDPGFADSGKFLFIGPPDTVSPQDSDIFVCSEGIEYEVIQLRPMYLSGKVTHFEGVMRALGRIS